MRTQLLIQAQFPISIPLPALLFPGKHWIHLLVLLKKDQAVPLAFHRESFTEVVAVSIGPLRKVACDVDIQRALRPCGFFLDVLYWA